MKYPIPRRAIDQNVIVLGKTGAGKSSAARSIVEPMLEEQLPVCIVDPKGDWWGIKLSADGKRPGYPLVVFGGKHADVPINERSGAHIAELFATGNRPCLIDLRGWMPGERGQFFVDFASSLYKHNVGRRWLVIDECHNFAPKGKVLDPLAGKSLHWACKLASEGRGLGINLIGLSQRPQKVHNDLLTSCETLIALRVLHASDRGAYKDWIDGCGDPAKGKEMLNTIANLKRGTGWVWSPEIEFGPELVTFPMFKTYDSFKPQEAGDAAKLTGWADVDLEDVKARFAAVIEEFKANDPAELKKRIRELEKQVARQEQVAPSSKDVIDAEQRGFERGRESIELAAAHNTRRAASFMRTAIGTLSKVADELDAETEKASAAAKQIDARPENPVRRVEPGVRAARLPESAPTVARARQIDGRAPSRGNGESLSKAERLLLSALAQYHPAGLSRSRLSILSGYSSNSSSFDNALSALRTKGYINRGLPIAITEDGVRAVGDFEPLPTGQDLRAFWLAKLGKAERTLLDCLIRRYPAAVSRSELSDRSGYSETSSSFDNALSKLRTLELITRGELRASEDLF